MSIRDTLKKSKMIMNTHQKIMKAYCCALTLISPELNTRIRYRMVFGKKINLDNPQTLNEKILWLKLYRYMKDPLVIQCADKYRVREYVEKCGCGRILNELIGVWESANQIPWEELPNQFALKWNFGFGMNIICSDKKNLDPKKAVSQLRAWEKSKPWLPYSEMQYKYTPKKIICEKYLSEIIPNTSITDYKVYCFHGKPLAILVMHNRNHGSSNQSNNMRTEFFDATWRPLTNTSKYKNVDVPSEMPVCFDEMMNISMMLSRAY